MKKWLALLLVLALIPAASMAATSKEAIIYKKVESDTAVDPKASYDFEITLNKKSGDLNVYVQRYNKEGKYLGELSLSNASEDVKKGSFQLKAGEYVKIYPTHDVSADYSVREVVPLGATYYPKAVLVEGTVDETVGSSAPQTFTYDYINSYNYHSLSGAIADSGTSPYSGKDQRADAESNLNIRLDGNVIDSKFYTVQWSSGTQLVDKLVDPGIYRATITGNGYVEYFDDGRDPLSYNGTVSQEVTFTITSPNVPESPSPDPSPVPTASPVPASSVPRTGDSHPVVLLSVLSVSSLLALTLILRRRKRA